jgi:hypothetical protein
MVPKPDFFGLVSYLGLHGFSANKLESLMGWFDLGSSYNGLVGFGISFWFLDLGWANGVRSKSWELL